MNFQLDPADEEFRAEVRQHLAAQLKELFPGGNPGSGWHPHDRGAFQAWSRMLDRKGWLVPGWAREWGGADWPAAWPRIFDDECCLAQCPPRDMIGIGFVGPVISTFGDERQKARFLPRIRNADDVWCQGFSEPQAGSDAMSLRTIAVRRGDHFVVDGQKLWTSNAHNADMMFALVRIDSAGNRRQQGLSFLLIDMHAPGVTVRPVITLDGRHWVNEVFLQNVQVPAENLIGEPGKGWVYARYLLTNERMIVAALPLIRQQLRDLREMLAEERYGDETLDEDPYLAARVAQLEIELQALDFMELRLLTARNDAAVVDRLAPMFKLRATELRQRVSELTLEVLGERALQSPVGATARTDLFGASSAHLERVQMATTHYLFHRAATIAGGTSEIQRNIISALALSL